MKTFAPAITDALSSLSEDFRPGELAYLALTVKIENPIRDRLAFSLHRKLADQGVVVAREWKTIDLALLVHGQPRALIELKAAYTFDIIKSGKPHECLVGLDNDVGKCFDRAYDNPEIYTLLLATHSHALPHADYECAVAYYESMRGYHQRQTDAEMAYQLSDKKVRSALQDHPLLWRARLDGGQAFGVAASVNCWLFGPYPKRPTPLAPTKVIRNGHKQSAGSVPRG